MLPLLLPHALPGAQKTNLSLPSQPQQGGSGQPVHESVLSWRHSDTRQEPYVGFSGAEGIFTSDLATNTWELPAISRVSEQRESCGCAGFPACSRTFQKVHAPLPWTWPLLQHSPQSGLSTSPHTLEVFCGISLNHTGQVPGPVVRPAWAALEAAPAG